MTMILLSLCFAIGLLLLLSVGFRRSADKGGSLAEQRMRAAIEADLGQAIDDSAPVKAKRDPLRQRIVDSISARLERSSALHSSEGRGLIAWLDTELILAGVRDRYTPYQALGVMFTAWIVGLLGFVLCWMAALPLYAGVGLLVVFALYPLLKLRALKAARKELIDSELAFFIMELVMALSSGRSNIDDALLRVAQNNSSSPGAPLAREFELACTEYRVGGKDREEALMDITRRTRNEGVEALVDGIIAALKTGADPLTALREQSEQARRLRKQALRTFSARQKPKGTLGMVATMGGGVLILCTPLVIGLFDVISGVS